MRSCGVLSMCVIQGCTDQHREPANTDCTTRIIMNDIYVYFSKMGITLATFTGSILYNKCVYDRQICSHGPKYGYILRSLLNVAYILNLDAAMLQFHPSATYVSVSLKFDSRDIYDWLQCSGSCTHVFWFACIWGHHTAWWKWECWVPKLQAPSFCL